MYVSLNCISFSDRLKEKEMTIEEEERKKIEINVHRIYNKKIDEITAEMLNFFAMRDTFIEIMFLSGDAFKDLNRIAEELENKIYDFQDFVYAEEVKTSDVVVRDFKFECDNM